MLTRGGICVPPTVTYLPYRVSRSTLTAVGRSQLLARWPETHSRILCGIHRATQTVLGVYSKRTCSRVTSASSALGVLNDYALYKSTHSLTAAGGVWGAHKWGSATCKSSLPSLSFFFFRIHYMDFPDCLLLLLSISVSLLFSLVFSFFLFLHFFSCRFRAVD